MKLPKFDTVTGAWEETAYPFPNTLAEALFPEVAFAIVHADPEIGPEALVAALPEGYQLDFATGSKKGGDFIAASGPVAATFWRTPEEAVAYGSNLLTPCWAFPPEPMTLTVLVVEDGERGTGDCHGKASLALWGKVDGDIRQACQFRLASKGAGVLAKGTLVVDDAVSGYRLVEEGIDLVLPRSAFKSSAKPEAGMHTWEAHLGVVAWSEPRPTKFGWQVLQWFSWETIERDLLPKAQAAAAQLLQAMTDVRALAGQLRLEAKDYELPLLDVILADEQGLLSQHPFVVKTLAAMLRRRWLDLAHGAGQKFTGLMALPNDDLPFGVIATHDAPVGKVIVTRYPLRSWADLRVWQNVGGSHIHRGVVYMSHETAAVVAGDFDGDFFQVVDAEEYPALTAEIETWGDRPQVEVVKVKERKASPMTQADLARVMLDNADNMVGRIALMIARANIAGRLDLVARLAQELQISVDKFKYNVEHDRAFLEEAEEGLPTVAWIKDRKAQEVYYRRPHNVGRDEGVVGRLVRKVNALWKPMRVLSRPLEEYADLLPKPEKHQEAARVLNARYGKLIADALRLDDEDERKEALSRVFKALKAWAEQVDDGDEWARALWHVAHRSGSTGVGSLPFHAFPAEIAKALETAEAPTSERVAIVGLKYNAYADSLAQFDGSVVEVRFALRPLNGQLRMAAEVGGQVLGFVSKETPVQQQRCRMALRQQGEAVYATAAV